ncbi:hypothetical protein N7513_003258 [Penicillium frequentans]|nr:hypothetical protein N7513_003258 [Penicillium glabrum]
MSQVENLNAEREATKFTFASQLRATVLNSWLNVLMLAIPAGIALHQVNANPIVVFVVNFIAIIPLAAMISHATEEIAMRCGQSFSALLNATFGNAVELIVAIIALIKGEIRIVQASLIGSMLSNLLLVLGMCFIFGGINRLEQSFNITNAKTDAGVLAFLTASLTILAAFGSLSNGSEVDILAFSRGTSVLLLLIYGCRLFFQLKSHAEMCNRPGDKTGEGDTHCGIRSTSLSATTTSGHHAQFPPQEPDDGLEQPQLLLWVAVLTLMISTALVGICAEFMVDSINALTATGAINKTFVGLILLPVVGNAVEHATAVTAAWKDKMDLAIGVAIGSCTQIALFVLPLIVILGWVLSRVPSLEMRVQTMSLEIDMFQASCLFLSVLLVNYLILDGKSNWLEGALLVALYLIISLGAWFWL